MAKNFRDSIRNKEAFDESVKSANSKPSSGAGTNTRDNDLKSKVHKYGNMSESQLMEEMMKVANQSKAQGTLSEQDLENFYKQAAPMLSEPQRNRLKQLIKTLR